MDAAAIEVLEGQGYLNDVPDAGVMVKLALTGNMSTGGISVDRTFDAHPTTSRSPKRLPEWLASTLPASTSSALDIAAPVRETGGAIVEVNAGKPKFPDAHAPDGRRAAVHRQAGRRPALPAGSPLPRADRRRHCTNGKTTTSRMIAHIFKGLGRKVGMTSSSMASSSTSGWSSRWTHPARSRPGWRL